MEAKIQLSHPEGKKAFNIAAEKYEVMAHFFEYNQPPTNDTFGRASS